MLEYSVQDGPETAAPGQSTCKGELETEGSRGRDVERGTGPIPLFHLKQEHRVRAYVGPSEKLRDSRP